MQTACEWAHEEFRNCEIADPRWGRRVITMGAEAARRPCGRVTDAFVDDAERQGAYGLLESTAVTPEAVGAGVFAACALRSAEHDFVFCPIDGTSLKLTDRSKTKGFGAIGTYRNGASGLKVVNAMVLSPNGVPIGISAQKWWTRAHSRRRRHRDQLRPVQKETGHWLDAIRQTRTAMRIHAPGTRCWFQLDREADAWPMLSEAGADDQWFTVRASHNRRVRLQDGQPGKLRAVMAQQPVLITSTLRVRAAPNRSAREATMVVRACSMTLDFRDKRTGTRFHMSVNVVQIQERASNPCGEKPIEWTLLTNHPIVANNDLIDVVRGYSMRWRIEELHRTWKSGACRVEESQLRSSSAVIKWATILIAVAVRIERIKQLSREEPDRPATDEFSPLEIRAAALLRFGTAAKTKVPEGTIPRLEDVTLWIAQLGGYTGRSSSGGPPGSITLARGLKDVRTTVKALKALGQ